MRRQGARRPPPREDPAQARHAPAGGFDNRTIGSSKRSRCSLQPGMTPVLITFFRPQNRGAVIRALPAARGSENNARFLHFLNGFCLYRDRISINCGPEFVKEVRASLALDLTPSNVFSP
jgi:hypothetical protein